MKNNTVTTFNHTLTCTDPDILLTFEHESNRQMSFAHTAVWTDNGTITIDITDAHALLLDLHHDINKQRQHRADTYIDPFLYPVERREKASELRHLMETLRSNGYTQKLISNKTSW